MPARRAPGRALLELLDAGGEPGGALLGLSRSARRDARLTAGPI
jgi:hypothetical protein